MTSDTQFGPDRGYFAAVAQSYDRLQPVIAGPSYAAGLEFMVNLVPHGEGNDFRFVELGCGTATLTSDVLAKFPQAQATAIDSEPDMLEAARRKLAVYSDRAQIRQADVLACDLPCCDLVLSSFMFHHVAPERLEGTLGRIAGALSPGGCLILLDVMQVGPRWTERVGALSRRLQQQHVAKAISAGRVTEAEIDARWAFKRRMKEEGRDVEYRHRAERVMEVMRESGFDEVGLVWRMFAGTILIGFHPERECDAAGETSTDVGSK
jgi:ubiquinone/menaquinone biosynthesis C-methylase UbiE